MEINNESQKDVTDKWLDVIFERVQSLELMEDIMKNGATTIMEFINYPSNQLQNINALMIKNMDFMIDTFGILFKNTQSVVKEELMKEMIKHLQIIKTFRYDDSKGGKIFSTHTHPITHKRSVELTSKFYIIASRLSKLRGDLIKNLDHLLWRKDDIKSKSRREL